MYLLVHTGSGSWRTYEGPFELLIPFGNPNSSVHVLRFHEGRFQVMHRRGESWGDIRNVALNGGLIGWLDNCAAMAKRQMSEDDMMAFLRSKGYFDQQVITISVGAP